LAFWGSRPLRISWLIVGMKPSPFIAGKPGGYFAQRKSAKSGRPSAAWPSRIEQCSALVRR